MTTLTATLACVAAFLGQPVPDMPRIVYDNSYCQHFSRIPKTAYACTNVKVIHLPADFDIDDSFWRAILAHEMAHTMGADEATAKRVEKESGC